MSAVDQSYAAWLKAPSLNLSVASPDAARWPTQGAATSVTSPFASATGARAVGGQIAAFLSGPLVREKAIVAGACRAVIHRCIRLQASTLGYGPEGELVFVIGVAEQDNGTSVLTILRKLA